MKIIQSAEPLMVLVREVASGRMLPAAMQRPYVWRKDDVQALCDSILSGFPVGSFLMWEPGPKADLTKLAKARLGPILPEAAATSAPYMLLLDGQNRLASLAWMMADEAPEVPEPSEAETETWQSTEKLVLDFETKSMVFVPREQAEQGLRLPAWTLLADSRQDRFHAAMRLVREKNAIWLESYSQAEIDAFVDFWDRARDRFRDARTTTTTIQNATPAEARHAFLRICRVGVPMAQEDFDKALTWASQPD